MKQITVSLLAITMLVVFACNKNKVDTSGVRPIALSLPDTTTRFFDLNVPIDKVTIDKIDNMAQLGRVLFYDRQLSLNNATACADCHKQEFAFSDNARFSRGFENRLTGRNSMAIQNMGNPGFNRFPNGQFQVVFGGGTNLFWDGRETILKNLILRPVTNHVEMGIDDLEALPVKLQTLSYYGSLFKKAFGDEEVTLDRISESVTAFLMAINSSNTRFDQYKKGQAKLNALELQGEHLFNTKYKCTSCHILNQGPYVASLSNFANIGLDETTTDMGAGGALATTGLEGSFKAPNLRNVAVTGPYMHDGRFGSLEDVIEHYSTGIKPHKNLDHRLRNMDGTPRNMNISKQEKQALVAFLKTFTDYDMLTDAKYKNPFTTR